MKESVLTFSCEGESLVGILAEPDGPAADVGVLIIVGGPQYRAGSHRQFTLLARDLATQGFIALRFDYRSMGDSAGTARDFLDVEADIAAAIEALMAAKPHLKGVVLQGLCDGASAALMYCEARNDPRVKGLALQNPWFRSPESQAQAVMSHYYGNRLRSPAFWKKVLSGGVGWAALSGWLGNWKTARRAATPSADFRDRMARAWADPRPVILQLAGADLTAQEFVLGFGQKLPAWRERHRLTHHEYPEADHTFSRPAALQRAHDAMLAWLTQEFPR